MAKFSNCLSNEVLEMMKFNFNTIASGYPHFGKIFSYALRICIVQSDIQKLEDFTKFNLVKQLEFILDEPIMKFIVTRKRYDVIRTLRMNHMTMHLKKKSSHFCRKEVKAVEKSNVVLDKLACVSDYLEILIDNFSNDMDKLKERVTDLIIKLKDVVDYDQSIRMVILHQTLYDHFLYLLNSKLDPDLEKKIIQNMMSESIILCHFSKTYEITIKYYNRLLGLKDLRFIKCLVSSFSQPHYIQIKVAIFS